MISLASAHRDETLAVNKTAAEIEANRLYEAGEIINLLIDNMRIDTLKKKH